MYKHNLLFSDLMILFCDKKTVETRRKKGAKEKLSSIEFVCKVVRPTTCFGDDLHFSSLYMVFLQMSLFVSFQ